MSNAGNIEIYNDIGNAYKAKGMVKEAEDYFSLYKNSQKLKIKRQNIKLL